MRRNRKQVSTGGRNVLFLITSLYGGGAEKVCCILASALAESIKSV